MWKTEWYFHPERIDCLSIEKLIVPNRFVIVINCTAVTDSERVET